MSEQLNAEMDILSNNVFEAFKKIVDRRNGFIDDCYRQFANKLDQRMNSYIKDMHGKVKQA